MDSACLKRFVIDFGLLLLLFLSMLETHRVKIYVQTFSLWKENPARTEIFISYCLRSHRTPETTLA